jgi:hypothetical protein
MMTIFYTLKVLPPYLGQVAFRPAGAEYKVHYDEAQVQMGESETV